MGRVARPTSFSRSMVCQSGPAAAVIRVSRAWWRSSLPWVVGTAANEGNSPTHEVQLPLFCRTAWLAANSPKKTAIPASLPVRRHPRRNFSQIPMLRPSTTHLRHATCLIRRYHAHARPSVLFYAVGLRASATPTPNIRFNLQAGLDEKSDNGLGTSSCRFSVSHATLEVVPCIYSAYCPQ